MINIENETGFAPDFDIEETAEQVAEKILSDEGCPYECETELLITDDESVRRMNKEFRDIDKTTDVLSFPNVEWDSPADFGCEGFNDDMLVNPDTDNIMLGQIVLNEKRIISQAEEYGHSIKREYAFLIAHSMLHLLGYDHMTEADAAVMEKKQDEYLTELGILR